MPGSVGIGQFPYTLSGEVPDMPAITLAQAQRLADILDPVPTIADLPPAGNWIGRTKKVQAYPGVSFEWNGTAWKATGPMTFATVSALNTTFMGVPANVAVLQGGSLAWITSISQYMQFNGTAWKYLSALVPVIPTAVSGCTVGPNGVISFTTVASFAARAYSAEFDNYMMIISEDASSNSHDLQLQLKAGAAAAAAVGYKNAAVEVNPGGAVAGLTTGTSFMRIGRGPAATYTNDVEFKMMSPFRTRHTHIVGASSFDGDLYARFGVAELTDNVSYDSFVVTPSAGQITGTARVYGIANN